MLISEFIQFVDVLDSSFEDVRICGAELDSRKVKPSNIFFACRGSVNNGNLYAQDAFKNGAAVVVMDDPQLYREVAGNKILVKDTLAQVLSAGKKRLASCCISKIAITGSYGKTGTKEMIRLALSGTYNVYASEGNHNNELGICMTACGIPSDCEVAVFEVGTNAPGEVPALSGLIRPDIAVITGVGHAHVGNFGDISVIAKEKLAIADYLAKNGVFVAHEVFKNVLMDDEIYKYTLFYGKTSASDVRILDCTIDGMKTDFTVSTADGEFKASINYPYPHLAENFLAAVIVGRLFNISYDDLTASADKFCVPEGRGNIINAGDLVIINDSYNASLEAVEKAVEAMKLIVNGERYMILGGIGEIGGFEREIYDQIYEKAAGSPDINFILSGSAYAHLPCCPNISVFLTHEDTVERLKKIGKGTVLVKASRSFGFEKYVDLLKNIGEANAL